MSFSYYFKKALSMPPHVVLRKALRKGVKKLKESGLRRKDFRDATYALKAGSDFVPLARLGENLPLNLSLAPVEALRQNSERFLMHEFNLLGSGWVKVAHGLDCAGLEGNKVKAEPPVTLDAEGRWLRSRVNDANQEESSKIGGLIRGPYLPIDWQLDFKSGFRWSEKTWSPEIQYGNRPGTDVKVPWELARSQHLPQMALAYGSFNEEPFRENLKQEFRNQVLDFIAANPPRFGVNWACTMDVGIRIANWLTAYDLFRSFGASWDELFEKVFARSVYEHAFHIFHHLEWDPLLRSNHYLADITGLLFASAYLPSSPAPDQWLKFSIEEFAKEVEAQFNEEGSNFEGSTSYHRLSAEMAVYGTALCLGLPPEKAKNLQPGLKKLEERSFQLRLERMGEFTMDVTKDDGEAAQLGDNDSGRFLKLLPEEGRVLDHRHLVAALKGLYDRKDFAEFSSGFYLETWRISHLAGGKKLKPAVAASPDALAYPSFGFYRLKRKPLDLFIRCGPVGQRGNGGHDHNDQLSFEMTVKGESLVVDPGTYVYTPLPVERNRFRSTAAHNTLVLEGKEQNQWEPGAPGLFQLRESTAARVIRFDNRTLVGEHQGFGVPVRRTFILKDNRLEGLDECGDPGLKMVYFHLAPGCQIQLYPPQEARVSLGRAYVKFSSPDGRWELEKGFYSRAYGEKEPSPVLVLKSSGQSIGWKIQVLES